MSTARISRFPVVFLAACGLMGNVVAQDAPPKQLVGHSAALNAVVYTPDQEHVLTVGADQTIRIWSTVTGQEIRVLSGHVGQVLSVASSPDSLSLVSGAADNTIKMWDVPRSTSMREFSAPEASVLGVATSLDGKWAVSFSDDLIGRIWNLEDGEAFMQLKGLTANPTVTAIRNDGNQVASGDEAGLISMWETLEGSQEGSIVAHQGPLRGLVFHPNNQQLVSAGEDGLLKVWQLPPVQPRDLAGHESPIRSVAVTNNGQLSVTGSDKSVRVHQVSNGQPIRELAGAAGPTHAIAVSANDAMTAAAGPQGIVKLWNLADGADRLQVAGHDEGILALAFHPDNSRFASAGTDGTIRIWRLPKAPAPLAGHTADVVSIAISPNGATAATASVDKTVRLWNTSNGQALRTLTGHLHPLSQVAIRADNAQVASGDTGGEVRFWDSAAGTPQGWLGAHASQLNGMSYSSSGERLATVGDDGLLKIWTLPTPAPQVFAGNSLAVTATAVTSDGKWIVTGGSDKTIRLFDAATAQQSKAFTDVPDAVSAVALSADDQLTVAGLANGVIKFWKTVDGTPWTGDEPPVEGVARAASFLGGHDGAIHALAFHAETKRVVSAGADGTIRVWRLPSAPEVFSDNAGPTTKFVVSNSGKLSASAGTFEGKPAIIIRDIADGGRVVQHLLGHVTAVTAIAFQSNESRIVSGGADGAVLVWDLADSKFPLLQSMKLTAAITAVALSDDGLHSFVASGNVIHQYLVEDATEIRNLSGHTGAVSSLAVAGPILFSGAADGTVRGWTIATGAAAAQMNHAAPVTDIAVGGDGKTVASCGADKLIKVWPSTGGVPVATLAGHAGPIVAVSLSGDGASLASVGTDGVWLWDVAGQRRLETIALSPADPRGVGFVAERLAVATAAGNIQLMTPHLERLIVAHAGGVTAMALTTDASKLVSAGADKALTVWNLSEGKMVASLVGHTEIINAVVVSSDGQQVVAGGTDATLRVWPLPAAVAAQPLPASKQWQFDSPILSLAIAADSNRVAVAGDDMFVRIWDLELGRELERLGGHTAAISDVAFSPGGATVLTASSDNTARSTTLSLSHVAALADLDAESPQDVAFLPLGDQVVVAGIGKALSIWSIGENGDLQPTSQLPKAAAPELLMGRQVRLAVRGDATQIASLDIQGRVQVWDISDGQLAYGIEPIAGGPPAAEGKVTGQLYYSGDQTRLAVAHGGAVRVLAADGGRLLQQWEEPAAVLATALTPNGENLIVGRAGATANADLRTLSLERLIEGDTGPVRGLAFTADGNGLASGGEDKMVRLWNTADGKLRQTFGGCEDQVASVVITRDGTRIVAGSADKTVRVWNITPTAPTPAEEALPPTVTIPIPAAVHWVSVTADNLKLAVASEDSMVRVLDLASGDQLQRFGGHGQAALAVAVAPDNKTFVSISERLARVDTLSLVRSIRVSETSVNDLALAGGGAQAVTAAKDGVKQWNLGDGNLQREFELPTPVSNVDLVANVAEATPEEKVVTEALAVAVAGNTQLSAVDIEGNLIVWNLANGQVLAQNQIDVETQTLRYSPDNLKLVAVGRDDHLRFYDPADASLTYELTSEKRLFAAAFTRDSRTVLTGGGQLRQWRYASPTAIRTLAGHGGPVLGLTYSPSGRWIASASADQTVRIWDANTGAQVKQLNGHVGAAYSVAFSPDESLLVSCGAEKGLRVWDVLGGRQLKQIPVGQSSLYSVAFMADGKRIVSAGVERKIYIVDLFSGTLQNTLEKHADYIYRVALNPDGTRLLSCGYSGNIMLWNPANGQLLFETNIGRVANFADLGPNGQRIVVASGDGNAYFVDVPTGKR